MEINPDTDPEYSEEKTLVRLREYLALGLKGPFYAEAQAAANAYQPGKDEMVVAGQGKGFGGLPKGTLVCVHPNGTWTVLWTPKLRAQHHARNMLADAELARSRGYDPKALEGWDMESLTAQCLKVFERANSSPEAFAEYKRRTKEEGQKFWLRDVDAEAAPGQAAGSAVDLSARRIGKPGSSPSLSAPPMEPLFSDRFVKEARELAMAANSVEGRLRGYLEQVPTGPLYDAARAVATAHKPGDGKLVEAGAEGADGFGGLPEGTQVYVRPNGSFTVLWTPDRLAAYQALTIIGICEDIFQKPLHGWHSLLLQHQCQPILERANSSPEAFAEFQRGIQQEGIEFWLKQPSGEPSGMLLGRLPFTERAESSPDAFAEFQRRVREQGLEFKPGIQPKTSEVSDSARREKMERSSGIRTVDDFLAEEDRKAAESLAKRGTGATRVASNLPRPRGNGGPKPRM